jgi:flagellar motor switch protein FliG
MPDAIAVTAVEGERLLPAPLASDEKAAIVVYSLGVERAEKVLSRMDESDYRRFARAMNRLGTVNSDTVEAVMAEFSTTVGDPNTVRGGMTETRKFLSRYLDSNFVDQIMDDIGGPMGRDIWEKLSNTPEQTLYAYLRNEQPQSVAVIFSRISAEKAAKVLQLFPEDRGREVVLRMSRIGSIDRRIMSELKATLQQDFLSTLQKQHMTRRPDDLLGGVFNQMAADRVAPMLQILEEHDPELAESVQKLMFTFADFGSRVNSAGLQAVIKNCERDTLISALSLAKHNAPKIVDYFFNNMSKRVAEQMREEMQNAGPIRMKDAQEAQQEVVRLAQALAKSGEIEISIEDDDDQQIVG